MLSYNKNISSYSRLLRKHMTDAEIRLWSHLKNRQLGGLQFYRQRIIGNYIFDFYCPKIKLVIEVDGGQHSSNEMMTKDTQREAYLKSMGLKTIRFNDIEALTNIEGVIARILENL